uniref:DUF1308 domain-containing protein n=1 Tax=Trypanosoma congolense (strain IL3000) TaxID=1068625 RepID=G0UZ36_TRYCI|nr:conserved hypothetical protein [Trypanosoma congolense IL3000]
MELYEWQPVEEELSESDEGSALLNLSAHCGGSTASISSSRCTGSGNSDEAVVCERMRKELINMRDRLERIPEHHVAVKNLSQLRQRIGKALLMVERAMDEVSRQDGEDESHDPITNNVDVAYFDALLTALENEPKVMKLFSSFPTSQTSGTRGVLVDLVSCGGLRWIKVRAASSWRLEREAKEGSWELPIARLLTASKLRRLPFMQTPEVVVLFSHQPPASMCEAIRHMGARPVSCAELRAMSKNKSFPSLWAGEHFLPPLYLTPRFICFDTTALVALCSEACFAESVGSNVAALRRHRVLAEQQRCEEHDCCVSMHIEPVLTQYTSWYGAQDMEALICNRIQRCGSDKAPIPIVKRVDVSWLEALIDSSMGGGTCSGVVAESAVVRCTLEKQEGRTAEMALDDSPNWIVADVTLAEFRWILETIAGPRELCRALSLLRCCTVVSTDVMYIEPHGSPITHVSLLASTGKVSARNLLVFGLSDAVGAVVLSSNRQLPNVALNEGIELMVASHPARALVEQKIRGDPPRKGPAAPPPVGRGNCY